MTEPVKAQDFERAQDDTLGLALTQAQDRLRTQIDMARGSDSRAQNLLSVCAAFTGAAVAGGLTALVNGYAAICVAGLAAAILWIAGAIFALRAMTPVDMDVPGWPPSSLIDDFRANKTYAQMVADMLVHLDAMISDNRTIVKKNAELTRTSMLFLVAAPIAAGLVGGVWFFVSLAIQT